MSKTARLRADDFRAIFRLLGECREMGDDRVAWREHFVSGATRLTGSDVGMTGEVADGRTLRPRDLGVTLWGWQTGFVRREIMDIHTQAYQEDPNYSPTMIEVFRMRTADQPGLVVGRRDVIDDPRWYRGLEYTLIAKAYGTDHMLFSFQTIPGTPGDDAGLTLIRAEGRRDYNGRERAMVNELLDASTRMVGGPLARFSEPSPMALPPRRRRVLACVLEGDGDKQIAARLGMSVYTVNEHIKAIFRHFGARSRPELMARWIRRGWGKSPPSWAEGGR